MDFKAAFERYQNGTASEEEKIDQKAKCVLDCLCCCRSGMPCPFRAICR